jgi:protein-tyrosine phosphatase
LNLLVEFTRYAKDLGPTLVHCQAGLNRSGLICALALVADGCAPADAITLLRERRCSAVLCNEAFERYVLDHGNDHGLEHAPA